MSDLTSILPIGKGGSGSSSPSQSGNSSGSSSGTTNQTSGTQSGTTTSGSSSGSQASSGTTTSSQSTSTQTSVSASTATTTFQSRLTNLSLNKLDLKQSTSSTRTQALSVQRRTQISSLLNQLGTKTPLSSAVQQLTGAVTKDSNPGGAAKVSSTSGSSTTNSSQTGAQKPVASVAKAYGEQAAS